MNLTLLFDLDDTLLQARRAEGFMPAYLQSLGAYMAQYAEPTRLIKTLLLAADQMTVSRHPNRTLEQTFDAGFYPPLGLEKESMRADLDAFYQQKFPLLQHVTQPRLGAAAVVRESLRRGYRVGVATAPLFPRTAILQRLSWAGLPPEEVPFDLIPSFETFHFAKPHPAYLAEFLAQMGWPEGPVVMIGDDLVNDIACARKLGIATYWVAPDDVTLPEGALPPTARGSLDGLLPWLDATPEDALLPDFNNPTALQAILLSTPAALATLAGGLSAGQWARRQAPKEWNPTEVLCHLRDVEAEVNLPRLQEMIVEENPFIPGQETDQWAEARGYARQDGRQALQDFTAARMSLLAMLEALPPQGWERKARHAIFGPTTLAEIVGIMAAHDRLHIRQFYQALAA